MVVPSTATTVTTASVPERCGQTVRRATSRQSICTVKTTPT